MKLWRISQSVNAGYDTYDSAIVAAETIEAARVTHPGEYGEWKDGAWRYEDGMALHNGTWTVPENVEVELIGTAAESVSAGVILASFNAG